MKVIVAGGTGFLGTPLVSQLRAGGNEVSVLTRRPAEPGQITWSPDGTIGPWARAIDGADAVINLTGESIAGHRWTPAHKARIRDSRIRATRSVVAAIHAAAHKPATLLNASAVGYYGSRGDDTLTEESPPGEDMSESQRRAIGLMLVSIGAATTIPAAMAVFRKRTNREEPRIPPDLDSETAETSSGYVP